MGDKEPIVVTPVNTVDISSPTLLDMLCVFWKDIQSAKYSPKAGDYAELNKIERSNSEITPISLLALDTIIYAAILRKFPVCASYSKEGLLDFYMKQRIKLSRSQSEESEEAGKLLDFRKE